MNLRYTLLAGVFAFAGLTSCEMKDELLNKGEESTEVGYLDLGLAVDASSQSVTKADEATQTNPVVSAQGFDVEIFKKNEETAYKTFTYDGEMEPVELPVGDYTVYAHSAGKTTDTKYKSEPFYGKEMPFSVEPNETYGVTVVCTMMNTKIQLTYDQELDDVFKSWNITVTDGTNIEKFKYEEESGEAEQPSPFYWFIAENISIIKVEFTGYKKDDGTMISESRSITKTSTSGSQYWEAADALSVTIKPGEKDPTNPSGVTGIEISANLTWNTDGKTDNIEVPVEDTDDTDDTEEPGDGDGDTTDGPTISFPKTTYSLPGDLTENADATIKADAGLKSVKVQIIGGNPMFKGIIAALADPESGEEAEKIDFLNGEELVNNTTLGNIIDKIAPGIPVLGENETEYIFPVGSFFNTLNNMGPTTEPNGHVFNITITDNNGKTTSGTLNVTVK